MSRAIERYVCASEDRSHYNNETDYLIGFRYPMKSPRVTVIQNITKTEIIEREVPEEKLQELIDARIPEIKETVINEIGDIAATAVTTEAVDEAINEIYGGSASDLVKEGNDG